MAATPVVSGPCAVWVSGQATTPVFLGYGVTNPRSVIMPRYSKAMSDRTGGIVPRSRVSQGQEALIFIEFGEWNDLVRESIVATPVATAARAGVNGFGDVGTLMDVEGAAFILYLVYPYAFPATGHPIYQAGGANPLVKGYRFVSTVLEHHEVTPGSQPNKLVCHFAAIPTLVTLTGALLLYDHNVSAVPTLTPL